MDNDNNDDDDDDDIISYIFQYSLTFQNDLKVQR